MTDFLRIELQRISKLNDKSKMARIYASICVLAVLTVIEVLGSKDIPKQMKRLYKQSKRGDSLGENINTVRHIQAHKGEASFTIPALISSCLGLCALDFPMEFWNDARCHFHCVGLNDSDL